MLDFDPGQLTLAARRKIIKRARRNVSSEVVLILTAGFALLLITSFWFGNLTFLPLAGILNMRPTVVWICLSAFLSGAAGLVHGLIGVKVVSRAREQEFLIHQFDELRSRS